MDLNKFHLLSNKKILILGSIIIVIILLMLIFLPKKKSQNLKNNPAQSVTYVTLQPPSPVPTNSAQLKQAIEEAKQSAREYDDWQANLRLTYPWLRKLPVADDKYYVYFDLKEEKFLGSVYPVSGDNVAIIKAEALRVLKEVKEIPVDDYQISWTVK